MILRKVFDICGKFSDFSGIFRYGYLPASPSRLLRSTAGLPGRVVSTSKSESESNYTSLSDDSGMG